MYLFIASLIVIYDSALFLWDLDQLVGDWNEQISFSNLFLLIEDQKSVSIVSKYSFNHNPDPKL